MGWTLGKLGSGAGRRDRGLSPPVAKPQPQVPKSSFGCFVAPSVVAPATCIFVSLFPPPSNADANAHSLPIRTRYLCSRFFRTCSRSQAVSTAGVELSISLEQLAPPSRDRDGSDGMRWADGIGELESQSGNLERRSRKRN